jgi:N-acetylglucosaminyldiphosphoundecaprenol N-acetyl-beta-D-mannosaminyltransferase
MTRPGPQPDHFYVAGVRIHAIDVEDAGAVLDAWIRAQHRDYVVLTGAHGVVEMQEDAELRRINNEAGLTTPDGMSVVWCGWLAGKGNTRKTYAPDVMEWAFREGVDRGYRHFLYGGTEGVADRLAHVLRERFPGIQVVGTYCPPFRPLTEEEADDVTATIDASGADIVWCGLGCPKQERWMKRFRPRLQAPVLIGVGAGFDFLSGVKPLAPYWIQRSGFEWFYRLLSEPRRLARRYGKVVPLFLWYALRGWLRDGWAGPSR